MCCEWLDYRKNEPICCFQVLQLILPMRTITPHSDYDIYSTFLLTFSYFSTILNASYFF